MARRYVEERHEASLSRRVVDVRPGSTQYAEWLSVRSNLCTVVIPQIIVAAAIPALAPPFVLSALVHIAAHVITRPTLPFRYPAANDEPDTKGKKGTGILLLGNVDSDSEYERFKEIWLSDDDLRKHMLIIGSTGSGKSEALKGIFFNALCWSSGFFVADGKADNKLPTDTFTMVRSFGRDDSLLYLNFLLGGKTPEQVRRSRRRRTNKINPVSSADADTIIQMGANMLPKVEGEGKNWQEKALNLWRAVIQALCYLRDTEGMDLSVATIIDHLALPMIEQLYVKGYEESIARGEWSYGFAGIKSYLDSGCPAYKVDKLLAKHGYGDQQAPAAPGRAAQAGKAFDQDSMAFEQHAYRTTQLMPVLNLLDKTYGFIFRDKYPEIDMIDITLNNRVLVMLIPSLEKSSQEAENLGKLAIACLRVMMGKNLGAEIEGTRRELLDSKATNAPYPYMIALDELAYYFSDGIAVMFAQARSLGMCMIAAAQDLEKLTEGNRAAEAGAMLANQVSKFFMRIDDANKTYEFIGKILGKVSVAVRRTFELAGVGYKRSAEVDIQEVERVPLKELQSKGPGEGIFNSSGKTVRAFSFYVGKDLDAHRSDEFFVLRFLQVESPSNDEIDANSIAMDQLDNAEERGASLLKVLRHERSRTGQFPPLHPMISSVSIASKRMDPNVKAPERAITLYEAAKRALVGVSADSPEGIGEGRQSTREGTAGVSKAGQESRRQIQPDAGTASASDAAQGRGASGTPSFLPTSTASPASKVPASAAFASIDADPAASAAFLDDGISADPLAFLNSPFERKPAEMLLSSTNGSEESTLLDEAGATGQPVKPDAGDVLERFIRGGQTMNLLRASPETDAAAAEAATYQALSAGPRPGVPSSFKGMPSSGISASDDQASWISDAVEAATVSLAVKSEGGKTVVGFSEQTMTHVAQIEEVLGSPTPVSSAKRLEVVVSAEVTPKVDPLKESLTDDADLDAIFDSFKRNKE